jgi:hypothetical protein
MFSVSQMGRIKQVMVFGTLALSLLAAGNAPLLGGDSVEAAKKQKKQRPDIAIEDMRQESHTAEGFRYIVVDVANVGKRAASEFNLELVVEDLNGNPYPAIASDALRIGKGETEEVRFKLDCDVSTNGTMTVSTDPSPVPGEKAAKTGNNSLTRAFVSTCLLPPGPILN